MTSAVGSLISGVPDLTALVGVNGVGSSRDFERYHPV